MPSLPASPSRNRKAPGFVQAVREGVLSSLLWAGFWDWASLGAFARPSGTMKLISSFTVPSHPRGVAGAGSGSAAAAFHAQCSQHPSPAMVGML